MKPTYGRVSTRGVVPLSWSLDHVGPMTRTVQDAALLLKVMAGYDPEDTASTDTAVEDYAEALAAKTSSLRIGIARAHFYEGLHLDVQEALDTALSVLRHLASSPRDVEPPTPTTPRSSGRKPILTTGSLLPGLPSSSSRRPSRRIRGGAEIDTVAYVNARRQLDQLRRSAPRIFETVDLLITPTTPVPPFSISELLANPDDLRAKEIITLRNTRPFNMLGLPTISVPCGFTQAGLPIGMQITGPPGGEATVLRLAHAYEGATDWHSRRPAVVLDFEAVRS